MILYETNMQHVYSIYENIYIDEHLDGYTENGGKVDNDELFRVIDIIDEDSHSRKAVVTGLKTKADKDKPKFFTFSNADEYKAKQKELSTPRQQRQNIRNIEKVKNKFKKAGNIKTYVAATNKQAQDAGINQLGAAYNPINNTVAINKNFAKTKDKLTRHKLLAHELRHRQQFKAVKKKYGASGKNVALGNASVPTAATANIDQTKIAGAMKAQKKFAKRYVRLPSEHDAFSAGANTKSIRDRSQITGNKKQLNDVADSLMSRKKMREYSKTRKVTPELYKKSGLI